MNFVRVIIFLISTFVGIRIVSDFVGILFYNDNVINVPGILNMWGGYGMVLICPYLVIYVINDEFNLSLPIGNMNNVGIILMIVIAPLFAIGTYSKTKANVADYVECQSERNISSRYSSRTYAINEELCLSLKEQH